jgi:hypothetical protein
MIVGRKYWILIWYGILLLGVLGLWASVYWARRTRWQNLEEVLRAVGTILVSLGMLLLLYQPSAPVWNTVATVLLVDALGCFVAAFILGRRAPRVRPPRRSGEERVRQVAQTAPDAAAADDAHAPVSPDTSPSILPPHSS